MTGLGHIWVVVVLSGAVAVVSPANLLLRHFQAGWDRRRKDKFEFQTL